MHGSLKGFNAGLAGGQITNSPYSTKILNQSKFMKKKRVPTFIRIINKEDNQFSQVFKYSSNLRFLREQNFKPELDMTANSSFTADENKVSNFLVLKSDLSHIKML